MFSSPKIPKPPPPPKPPPSIADPSIINQGQFIRMQSRKSGYAGTVFAGKQIAKGKMAAPATGSTNLTGV